MLCTLRRFYLTEAGDWASLLLTALQEMGSRVGPLSLRDVCTAVEDAIRVWDAP